MSLKKRVCVGCGREEWRKERKEMGKRGQYEQCRRERVKRRKLEREEIRVSRLFWKIQREDGKLRIEHPVLISDRLSPGMCRRLPSRASTLRLWRSSSHEASQSPRSEPQFGNRPASSLGLAGRPDLVEAIEWSSVRDRKIVRCES